jgi:hypothetical protein
MKRTQLARKTPLRRRNDSIKARHCAYFEKHCRWIGARNLPSREYRLAADWLVGRRVSGCMFKVWFYNDGYRDGLGAEIALWQWADRIPLPGRYGLSRRRAATLPGERTARSFGSGWEGDRATFLKLRELAGEITDLEHQKVYHLCHPALPGLDIPYTSDASYIEAGRLVVEDTKGAENERFKWIKLLWPWLAPDGAPLLIVKKGKRGQWVTQTIHARVTSPPAPP